MATIRRRQTASPTLGALPPAISEPPYVAAITAMIFGIGLWGYGKFGGGEGDGAMNAHFRTMSTAGLILGAVSATVAVGYLIYRADR